LIFDLSTQFITQPFKYQFETLFLTQYKREINVNELK